MKYFASFKLSSESYVIEVKEKLRLNQCEHEWRFSIDSAIVNLYDRIEII